MRLGSPLSALGALLLSATSLNLARLSCAIEAQTQEQNIEDFDLQGVSKVYETIDLYVFQSFFDTVSEKFIPPLLEGLDVFTYEGFNFTLPLFDEDLTFDVEIQNIKLENSTISQTPPIVTINNSGSITLAFNNLTLNLTMDYSYISDPPIFADIGSANILLPMTNFTVDVNSYFRESRTGNTFEIEMQNINLNFAAEPFCNFDGLSDFSEITTNVINTVAAVVRNRIESFVNGGDLYKLDGKIQAAINSILELVPSQVDLGGGLYLDGFLYEDIEAGNGELVIRMRTQLRYENATFDSSDCDNKMHPKFTTQQFDMQMAMNDCTINELIFSLYESGHFGLPIKSSAITTTLLRVVLGKDIVDVYGSGQPCELILRTTDLPQFTKNFVSYDYDPDNYWILTNQLAIDVLCVPEDSETGDFEPATTLLMDLDTHFNANITYAITVGFEVYSFDLKYTEAVNSTIDVQSKIIINRELGVAINTIGNALTKFFNQGHSFNTLLYNTPLCWLNINQIYIVPNYGEAFLWGGLTPCYSPEFCPNGEPYGEVTKMLLEPKSILAQIVQNIVDSITNVMESKQIDFEKLQVDMLEQFSTIELSFDQESAAELDQQ